MRPFCAVYFFICSTAIAGVVQPLQSAAQLLIPAASSTPGVNGTFFRSDIAIVNLADHDQNIRLRWLPQGISATSSMTIVIASHRILRSADFVREVLAQSGLGAIIVTGVTSAGDLDPTAALYVKSRVWTKQPGSSGTTSQSLPAIPIGAATTSGAAALISVGGMDAPAHYRSNVGIVNLDPAQPQTFSVELAGSAEPGLIVVVPPSSMQLVSIGSGLGSTHAVFIRSQDSLNSPATLPSFLWIAYGSTIDNVTGDAWSELAVSAPVQGPGQQQ